MTTPPPAVQHLNTRPTQPNPDTTQEPAVATYTTETTLTRTRRWIVPATAPWGAAAAEIAKAWEAASSAYLEAHGLPADTVLADDALRFMPSDEAIVISFTVEERQA